MIGVRIAAVETLKHEGVRELVNAAGPSMTLGLPAYRPGARTRSAHVLLRTYLKEAETRLADRKVPAEARENLLEPLRELSEDPELLEGSRWSRMVFRSPGMFRQFSVTTPVRATLTLAGCFLIRPLLAELQIPSEFYLLELSKRRVALLRCANFHVEPVALPQGVAESLEEAMAFEPPDHDLENRSSAGPSVGNMRSVRFGTGSGRERQHTHLADFYKRVDRGVGDLLRASRAPLVLAGVVEDTALYRSVSDYPALLQRGIQGSPGGFLDELDLLQPSYAILRAVAVEREVKALQESRERAGAARFSTDLETILAAAARGRVDRLYVDESARKPGVFENKEYRSWGEEDLLNLAAVQTVLHGGQALSLPSGRIGDGAAAAILRF